MNKLKGGVTIGFENDSSTSPRILIRFNLTYGGIGGMGELLPYAYAFLNWSSQFHSGVFSSNAKRFSLTVDATTKIEVATGTVSSMMRSKLYLFKAPCESVSLRLIV